MQLVATYKALAMPSPVPCTLVLNEVKLHIALGWFEYILS